MSIGYQIAQNLKQVNSPDGNDRLLRAMLLASALGYFYPVDPLKSASENAEFQLSDVRKVISKVNESIALDTKLCVELFKQVISIRLELINGVSDPAIIAAAMSSYTAEVHQTGVETLTATTITSNLEFMKIQNGIAASLRSIPKE